MDALTRIRPHAEVRCIAMTGATGFVGRRVARELLARNWRLRLLVRRPTAELEKGTELVHGSMEDDAALRTLVRGAAAVVHCAGLVRARRVGDFRHVNARGTARLIAAVREQPEPPRVLLVSSLAAREPRVSAYATSKREAEDLLAASTLEHCIVRPPAVYGPGDKATLPVFRLLASRVPMLPGTSRSRFSLIFVDDLATALATILDIPRWNSATVEPDDRHPRGYSWLDLAAVAERALGRRARPVLLPKWLVLLPVAFVQASAAVLDHGPMVTLDKLKELYHDDWVCRQSSGGVLANWRPTTEFRDGFRRTLDWYVANKWISCPASF